MAAPIATTALALVTMVGGAHAQETHLERWTFGYLAETWTPRWIDEPSGSGATAIAGDSEGERRPVGVGVSLFTDQASFRNAFDQSLGRARVQARARAGRRVTLRATAATGGSDITSEGREFLQTARSEAGAVGGEVRLGAGRAGAVGLSALVGWDAGLGGQAELRSASSRHELGATVWQTESRATEVVFPADSLRDLTSSHRVRGLEVRSSVSIGSGEGGFRPHARWVRELFDPSGRATDGFLTAAPDGSHTLLAFGLEMGDAQRSLSVTYRERSAELEARIDRVDAQAGRLPVATLDLAGWSARLRQLVGDATWSFAGGSDHLTGFIAARVETWPFLSLWETLSAQAYRLNGEVTARTLWLELGRSRIAGIGWSAQIGRYELRVDRDSWYVTSFGFGRSDQQSTVGGVEAMYMVGGEIEQRWRTRGGRVGARAWAGLPVYGRELPDATAVSAGGGLAGYVGAALEWAR